MVWFFHTKSEINRELEIIREDIKRSKIESESIHNKIVSEREIDIMIREAVLILKETPNKPTEATQNAKRRKINRIINRAEIMQEMRTMIESGLTTGEMFEKIVTIDQKCKNSCFYKYLRGVREQKLQTTEELST